MHVEPLTREVFFMGIPDDVRGRFFSGGVALAQKHGGIEGFATVAGMGQPGIFGFMTDSARVDVIGTQGAWDSVLHVFVDGVQVGGDLRPGRFAYRYSGLRLDFGGRRFRRIEVVGRFTVFSVRVNGTRDVCGTVWPAPRSGLRVGILGDSWIDGTSQAPVSIGQRLCQNRRLVPVISAIGGTGLVKSNPYSPSFVDKTRLGTLATVDLDVVCVFGSPNDADASRESIADNAQTVIKTLRAKNPSLPILFTGMQIPGGAAHVNEALAAVVARNKAVTFARTVDIVRPQDVGPEDLLHPNQAGADSVAAWLGKQILSAAGRA
jgi:lysophospholipase L1-like esterase